VHPWVSSRADPRLEQDAGRSARLIRQVPSDRLRWKPEVWDGSPGESFSALEHVCHVRDIERDGYRVRIRRLLDENDPSLVSLDGDELARETPIRRGPRPAAPRRPARAAGKMG
jgi:hypothetical protein